MRHPATGHELSWNRETLELPAEDERQLVVYLPAGQPASRALGQPRLESQDRALRAI